MTDETASDLPQAIPDPVAVGMDDLRDVLRKGVADFRAAPGYGLFFGGVFVLGGIALYAGFAALGQIWWAIPFTLGFPILAPFFAVGMYEVSRRLEAGETLDWGGILAVVFRQRDKQIPILAVVIVGLFLAWMVIARIIFAVFMSSTSMVLVTSSMEALMSGTGLMMLLVGSVVGAAFATLLFSITVISLPLLLDRDIDFVTAMITSFSAVQDNPKVMLTWGAIVAGLLFAAMLPAFLGLFFVLPVLGHASWHLYRRILP